MATNETFHATAPLMPPGLWEQAWQLPGNLLAKTFAFVAYPFIRLCLFIADLVTKAVTFVAHLPGAPIVANIAIAFCNTVEHIADSIDTALGWVWWCIGWVFLGMCWTLAGVLTSLVAGVIWFASTSSSWVAFSRLLAEIKTESSSTELLNAGHYCACCYRPPFLRSGQSKEDICKEHIRSP